MPRKPKIPRKKLQWCADAETAMVSENFYVCLAKGADLNPGYYDLCRMGSARCYYETSWYAFLWSYVPEKDKFLRRELGHGSKASMRKLVEEYVAKPEVEELLNERQEAYTKKIFAEKYAKEEAKRKHEEKLAVEQAEQERKRLIQEGLLFQIEDYTPARLLDI